MSKFRLPNIGQICNKNQQLNNALVFNDLLGPADQEQLMNVWILAKAFISIYEYLYSKYISK